MAKKQANINETAAAASLPRAAKSNAPRVKAAKHSKGFSNEPTAALTPSQPASSGPAESAHAVIERIAYGYWEARGFQGGNALEDWVRAENEYHQQTAATRL